MSGPFLKWVGGKSRMLTELMPLLPRDAAQLRHCEPFAGGAALFFGRVARGPAAPGYFLSDSNHALIDTYGAVRDDVAGVTRALEARIGVDYYAVREAFNELRGNTTERAAMFIYLNRTCFNGLYRVNREGDFNVPKGDAVFDERMLSAVAATLRSASAALQGVALCGGYFTQMLQLFNAQDFIYFDPPYAVRPGSSNFTAYAVDGFGADDQRRLSEAFRQLDARGCKLMLSNANTLYVRHLYEGFEMHTIKARRSVAANGAKRGAVDDLIVRNYA